MLKATTVKLISTAVVTFLAMFGLAVPAQAAGGVVSIVQSLNVQGGGPSQAVNIPAGSSFTWTVNITCSNDDCHDGVVRLNFPSTLTAGTANYSVSEVNRVVRSSTQVTFILNSTIAVGTSSQITLEMTAPSWTTPDGTVASMSSGFSTSDGQSVTTTSATATVQSGNTTTLNSVLTAGGRTGGRTSVTVTACPVAPVSSSVGPWGIAANSVLIGVIPAGATFVEATGATYNSSNRQVTWVIPLSVVQCVSYVVTVSFPVAGFSGGSVQTFTFSWTGKNIGSTEAFRSLGTSSNQVTLQNAAGSGSSLTRISDPAQKHIGGTGFIRFVVANPNDSSQQLDSIEISENVPEGLALSAINVVNTSGGSASVYIKSAYGADGIQGNADDSVEYLAQESIAAGASANISVASQLPSGAAAISGGNYVTTVRGVFGSIPANSGSLNLLSYGWTVLATTRSGGTVAVGDVFSGTANFSYTETVPGAAQTTQTAAVTSTTTVIAVPPPPQPFLTTRNGLRNNLSATLLPGVRSVPMSGSFAAFNAVLPEPIVFLVQPPNTSIPTSSLAVTLNGQSTTSFTTTRVENFSYSLTGTAQVGELIKITFPAGTQVNAGAGITVTYTLDLLDTLIGNPRIYNAFGSRTNNSYGVEAQWWGTWCDTAADLDTDGINGNGLCNSGDVKPFPLFFTEITPATSVSAALTQAVKGSWDADFIAGPSTGYTTPAANDGFRVSLRNKGTVAMNSALIITTLPRPGDTNVLNSTARTPSTHTFPIQLTSTPTIPNGLTGVVISYSVVDDICRTELGYDPSGCNVANWSTTPPADLKTVTAIKFELGNNVLNPGITWNFDMTVTTPATGATEPDFAIVNTEINSPSTNEKAKSSSAFVIRQVGQVNMLSAAESPAVTLAMPGPYGPAGIPPTAPDKETSGVGVTPQTTSVVAPSNGSVALLNVAGSTSTDFTVPGQGRYTFTNGTITFTPVVGFLGVADSVFYRVTDVFGQTAIATYTATVSIPSGPSTQPGETTRGKTLLHQFQPSIPTGGSLLIKDENGVAGTSVTIPGKGTYTVVNGKIHFQPEPNFVGVVSIPFVVVDAYGQEATATYTTTVTAVSDLASTGQDLESLFTIAMWMLVAGLVLIVRRFAARRN